jgi:hypothetical protein
MVSFTWKFFTADPMDILWRIDTPTFGNGLKTLEGIDVCCPPLFGVTLIFHHIEGAVEVDVAELDDLSKANARRLLKHLKYQKAERWSWRRATEEPEPMPAVNGFMNGNRCHTDAKPPVTPNRDHGCEASIVVNLCNAPPAAAPHRVPFAFCV